MRRWVLAMLLLFAPLARAEVSVTVNGVDDVLRENIRATLSIVVYSQRESLTEASIRRLHGRAPEEIRQALKPYGYYHPQIDSNLQRNGEDWQATYNVRSGPAVHIAAVNVDIQGPGANDRAFAELRHPAELKVGNRLLHTAYEDYKTRLQATAARHGYLDATFTTHRLEINPDTDTARIELAFATGPQYFFGPVSFDQQIMENRLLRRYLHFKPGDPYNTQKLLDLQYALIDSEYYSLVDVEPQRDKTVNQHVPIVVHMQPKPKYKYTFGLGYGTDTGPRVSVGWYNRRVNRIGHHASMKLQVSKVQKSFDARYYVPLADPATEQIVYSFGASQSELGDTYSEKQYVGIGRTTLEGSWQQTAYLNFERERNEIADDVEFTRLLLPGVTWTRTVADTTIVPRHGWRVQFDVRGTNVKFSSTSSFLQGHLQYKWIKGFGGSNRILTRFDIGYTNVSATTELPLSQRFFAGGDQSVRGFAYQSLGPTDADGNVVGGRDLLTGSVELEHMFSGDWHNWGVAVFTDAGNAMNNFSVPIEQSAGVGMRWKTPVGMLRVDVAKPLTEPDLGWRLHISLGPDL